jgi:hypothetical protein
MTRHARGRLAAVSIRTSAAAGWWVGVALGSVAGALLAALVAWFAGAVLAWQRELAFTLGVTRTLLPFGDQIPMLRWLSANWIVVVPAGAVIVAIVAAVLGAFIGAFLAAAYNRSPRQATIVIELDDADDAG